MCMIIFESAGNKYVLFYFYFIIKAFIFNKYETTSTEIEKKSGHLSKHMTINPLVLMFDTKTT